MTPSRRRLSILVPLYAVLAVVWVMVSLFVDPDLSHFVEPGLVVLALSLAFTLGLGRWEDQHAARRSPEDRARHRWINGFLIAAVPAFLVVTLFSGERHDYIWYMGFWSVVRQGEDPWYLENGFWGLNPPNAYGPLFNLLAFFPSINRLIPKLLFAAAYLAPAVVFTKDLATRGRTSRLAALGLIAWAWTPYVWIEVAIRGHFDVLVGLASMLAVHARRRNRDFFCASALAAGVLLKYIPIVLLPFLALDRGRIRFRLALMASVLIALGLGLSCLEWGPSTFAPLTFAATRSSAYLSIFRFLRGRYSPFLAAGHAANFDRFCLPVLSLALLGAWWWCRARRTDPATAAVLAMLVTLLLYRNGFPQYQMVLLMLTSYWISEEWEHRRRRTVLAIALTAYFGWLVAFDLVYYWIEDSSPRFEDAVGLPTFVLGCALIACIVRSEPGSGLLRTGEKR
jgi:hypothetical protein